MIVVYIFSTNFALFEDMNIHRLNNKQPSDKLDMHFQGHFAFHLFLTKMSNFNLTLFSCLRKKLQTVKTNSETKHRRKLMVCTILNQ